MRGRAALWTLGALASGPGGWQAAAGGGGRRGARRGLHAAAAQWERNIFYDTSIREAAKRVSTHPLVTRGKLYRLAANKTLEARIESAQLLHSELPTRLAQRIVDYQQLPYIVGCDPHLFRVYEMYLDAFQKLREFPAIHDHETERKFTETLKEFIDDHTLVISLLANGCRSCKDTGHSELLDNFLHRTLTSRIGIRLLVEHQVALHADLEGYHGVIKLRMSPVEILERNVKVATSMCEDRYGAAPQVRLHGQLQAKIPQIPAHVEYMCQELLKNAMRAVSDRHRKGPSLPVVVVTVCENASTVILRFSDEGGGIAPPLMDKIWDYSFTTIGDGAEEEAETAGGIFGNLTTEEHRTGPLAGQGFGLPMSRSYAEYFGGSLHVQSMHGHGCDVYLELPKLNATYKDSPLR